MYNKLFTKILDSSIWLESTSTRLVWLTMIAAMDETGFTQFASIPNLAHRARVSMEEATAAIDCLERPDPNSSDPDNEGRRIERVPGGWIVLNAGKYRDLVKRSVIQEQTRLRVAAYRDKKACNARVTHVKRSVTPSEAEAEAENTPVVPKGDGEGLRLEGSESKPPAKPIVWTPHQTRINKLFNRRVTNPWTDKELKRWRVIRDHITDGDLDQLERYYSAASRNEKMWRFKSVTTLLGGWDRMMDEARNYKPASCF